MRRVLPLLCLVSLLTGCRHHPTAPDPYKDHQACLDAGGQWGPWASHYGCKLPGDP